MFSKLPSSGQITSSLLVPFDVALVPQELLLHFKVSELMCLPIS